MYEGSETDWLATSTKTVAPAVSRPALMWDQAEHERMIRIARTKNQSLKYVWIKELDT